MNDRRMKINTSYTSMLEMLTKMAARRPLYTVEHMDSSPVKERS